jgi:amino acid adenylation domain-containing protein
VRQETLAAICVERSVEMFVGLLGILKAGAAYLPLDASYPMARLVTMLEDSQAPVLLTQERLADTLPALSGHVICLDTDWDRIGRKSTENPARITNPANLAYVIYTSGSKGQPHGVEVSHSALLNLVNWHQEAFEVSPADRATQIASPSFDASVWEVWPYLCCGASLHLPPEDVRLSPALLQEWLISRDVTISFVPTPLADLMIGMEWPATLQLRILLTGGDQLHQHSRDAHRFTLVNNYGPTENAVVTTSGTVVSCENALAWPSIGFAIANTRCYVLDETLRPAPLGVRGELYIAGRGLARGYLRQAALTAERFIPNPLGAEPGARIYRTGDAVRQLADGSFEFLGRLDQQVKIRGFRIELGEIETLLSQHPTVDQCAVLARTPETSEDKQLVAYVVSKPDAVPEPGELRRYLQERLPDYMVVAHFVMLDEMPLTSNAKVDRRALLAIDYVGAEVERAYVAPRTQVEEVLADIWAEVLGRERVGIDDDFFELGGHSLLATQVIARVRDTFQVTLPVRTVFEARTIADLSLALTTNEAQPGSTEKIARVVIRLKNMSDAEKAEIFQRQKSQSVSLTQ